MANRSKDLERLGIAVIALLIAGIIPSGLPTTSQAFSSCTSPLPPLGQTFYFSQPLSMALYPFLVPSVNVTVINNASIPIQIYVWAVAYDLSGQTVYIGLDNGGTVGCGQTSNVYVPMVLVHGLYNVSVSLTTPSMITISTTQTFLFNFT